jgi:hypothetical protein
MTMETIRKSVPLTPGELAAIAAARTEGTAEHDALLELAGTGADRSEATALQALVALGLAAVKDRVQERGYAALASSQDDEDRAYQAAMRRRSRGSQD